MGHHTLPVWPPPPCLEKFPSLGHYILFWLPLRFGTAQFFLIVDSSDSQDDEKSLAEHDEELHTPDTHELEGAGGGDHVASDLMGGGEGLGEDHRQESTEQGVIIL